MRLPSFTSKVAPTRSGGVASSTLGLLSPFASLTVTEKGFAWFEVDFAAGYVALAPSATAIESKDANRSPADIFTSEAFAPEHPSSAVRSDGGRAWTRRPR